MCQWHNATLLIAKRQRKPNNLSRMCSRSRNDYEASLISTFSRDFAHFPPPMDARKSDLGFSRHDALKLQFLGLNFGLLFDE